MGVLGLAGLPPQRNGSATSTGRCPHLCPPLCPFSLVGIAGEDDLNYLQKPKTTQRPLSNVPSGLDDWPTISTASGRPLQPSGRRVRAERIRPPTLPSDASEKLCRQLISELEQLQDPEELASWITAHSLLKTSFWPEMPRRSARWIG
jgi:hypothetical protein